jgi:hypothetical protein
MSAEDLLDRAYKSQTFREMNRHDFFVAIIELADGLASPIAKDDVEYNKALMKINDSRSKEAADKKLISETEKLSFLEKLIFVGQKSPTKSKALTDLLG